jgi:hypothetical protein
MRTGHNSMTFANLSVDDCCSTVPGVNVQIFRITRQNLDTPTLQFLRIEKDSTAIVIALERILHTLFDFCKSVFMDLQIHCPSTGLTSVDEPFKSQSPTCPRKEGQLSVPHNRHLRVINFELAPCAAIVPSGTEAQIRPASIHVPADTAIAFAIEGPAIPKVCTTGEDE